MAKMAEALVKNPYCSKCGEDARPQAQFCFACGGPVVFPETAEDESVSEEWFKGDIVDSNNQSEEAVTEPDSGSLEAIPSPSGELVQEESVEEAEEVVTKVQVKEKSEKENKAKKSKSKRMRSAADIRERPKPTRMKRVEVVWEEKTDSPNWIFLAFGLGFCILAGLVVYAAIYLK